MTPAGFVFMGLSWAVIIIINVFCFIRLSSGGSD
jgi:hypothetical protein